MKRPLQRRAARDDLKSSIPVHRASPEDAAGPLDDESARGDVPEADAMLDVCVEPARRHVHEGERGCAHDADLAHAVDEVLEDREHAIEGAGVLREAECDDRMVETRARGGPDAPAVE